MSPVTTPVGQPLPGASFAQGSKRFFRGYVHFSGRASRSEFWWAMLCMLLLCAVAYAPMFILAFAMEAGIGADPGNPNAALDGLGTALLWFIGLMVFAMLVALALALPSLAVMWRRLQDAGFHGAFTLLSFVGLGIVPLVMCFFESNPEGARFDPSYRQQAMTSWAQGQQPGYPAPGYAPQPQSYGGLSYGGQPYGEQR